mgnify:CR=1 FL=1
MGRYTSDDNRSMQLNPENERYWSSRGYDDDDYYDDEVSSFNQEAWEKKREIEFQEHKEIIDSASINILGKKVIFIQESYTFYNSYHPAATCAKKYLFELVLKESESVKKFGFTDKRQEGLTVKFESFKSFLEKHLDYDLLAEEEKKLTERVKEIEESHAYKYWKWGSEYDTLHKESIKIGKIKRCLSLKLIKRILDEKYFVSNDVKRNYIYFNNVYISNSYMIFQIDPSSQWQGSVIGGMWDNNWSWMFSNHSCDTKNARPEVIYENFEDVFTCKKYLIDL